MHILEFNVVSGSIILKCRDVFRCPERFVLRVWRAEQISPFRGAG